MASEYLELESCNVTKGKYVSFLEDRRIQMEFRNISNSTVKILKVSCKFTVEDGLKPNVYESTEPIPMHSQHTAHTQIPVEFGLELKQATNNYTISVEFKPGNSSELKEERFTGRYVIMEPKRDPDPPVEFFVSHRILEDEGVARKFKFYLKKVGFNAYLAEDNSRPSSDVWNDKILPAIDRCTALIVLWTESEASASIKKEIKRAEKNKPIIHIMKEGLKVPKTIPKNREYLKVDQFTDEQIIKKVGEINHEYETGGFKPKRRVHT